MVLSSDIVHNVDLLIHAKWVIPVNKNQDIFTDHSVAINNGKIIGILPSSDVGNYYIGDREINLKDHALIPGFINAHGHAAMSLFRGMADDQELMEWLNNHIWPAEGKWVSDKFVSDGTRLAVAEMIRCGTTTFSDNYFYPDAVANVAFDAGINAQIVFPVSDIQTMWSKSADESITKGLEAADKFKNIPGIKFGFGPHAPYTVSDETLKKIAVLAEQLDFSIQMHIHETASEIQTSIKEYKKRPLQRLCDLNLLSERLQCVHMTQMTEDDLDLVMANGCHVVHCPESNMKLASGFMPLAKMQSRGLNVALGTDGCASNNDLDMIGEMRSAALLAKVVANNPTSVRAYEALELATINGAKAMGIDDKTGSLEVGKQADIAAVSLCDIENIPLYSPVSQLVYTSVRSQVTHVWANGLELMNERKLLTLDEATITDNACGWLAKIKNKS